MNFKLRVKWRALKVMVFFNGRISKLFCVSFFARHSIRHPPSPDSPSPLVLLETAYIVIMILLQRRCASLVIFSWWCCMSINRAPSGCCRSPKPEGMEMASALIMWLRLSRPTPLPSNRPMPGSHSNLDPSYEMQARPGPLWFPPWEKRTAGWTQK